MLKKHADYKSPYIEGRVLMPKIKALPNVTVDNLVEKLRIMRISWVQIPAVLDFFFPLGSFVHATLTNR